MLNQYSEYRKAWEGLIDKLPRSVEILIILSKKMFKQCGGATMLEHTLVKTDIVDQHKEYDRALWHHHIV